MPGDEIVGFVTRGAGVSVHRGDCTNVKSLASQPGRMVEVEWAPTAQSMFLSRSRSRRSTARGCCRDITRVLSDVHVNILSASVDHDRDRIAKSRFTFEMADPTHLGHVLKAVRTVDGVFDAYRVTQ